MPNAAVLPEPTESPGCTTSDFPVDDHDKQQPLPDLLAAIQATLAPLWPLKDFVAVNPFVGLSDQRFLSARESLRQVRDGELLLPLDYFRTLVAEGQVTGDDLKRALEQCCVEYPQAYSEQSVAGLLARLESAPSSSATGLDDRVYRTVAEATDRLQETDWATAVTQEISRHCANHYDQGQALWPSPWKHLPLYEAWRETAQVDRRFEKLGVRGFRQFVAALPDTPLEAIEVLLSQLRVPPGQRRGFLTCQLLSISGWASYVKYRVREAEMAGGQDDDLIGLLAIRLAYDAGLIAAGVAPGDLCLYPELDDEAHNFLQESDDCLERESLPTREVLDRYWLQVATETAYGQSLRSALAHGVDADLQVGRRVQAQMVFCIDVRSEVIRRHLESVSDAIETFGFAGFFGLPLEYVPMGLKAGSAQCPVLLKPGFQVHEDLREADAPARESALERRTLMRLRRQVWKSFQLSAASSFSFVESIGLAYVVRLILSAWGLSPPVDSGKFDGVSSRQRNQLGPVLHTCGDHGLSLERQVDLAEGILRNLGLTSGFARIVALCGHASETVNNPYQAGLDCGACGGHSGESNARVAAILLNDPSVRAGLSHRGIQVPQDVWFVAAVHNTTTDDLHYFDVEQMPASHAVEFQSLREWSAQAGCRTRDERALRLGSPTERALLHRSRDWAEVRPEWGLAGNAAFVVAPRSRTRGLQLDGRTFLHSYDYRTDPEGKVLELIMTAPMVVTNWINLQYYASAVDNRAYGSGNKVLHNVVGQLGVVEGNGGDLMTGLPWQSVHDGQTYQHQPLRLLVVIEAPRAAIEGVLRKHAAVRDLVCHGWLSLTALEDNRFYRYSAAGNWHEES